MDGDTTLLLNHIIEIKESVAALHTKVNKVESVVSGNGQPGLLQKVEELQSSKNRLWGAMGVVSILLGAAGGILEWFFHRGR